MASWKCLFCEIENEFSQKRCGICEAERIIPENKVPNVDLRKKFEKVDNLPKNFDPKPIDDKDTYNKVERTSNVSEWECSKCETKNPDETDLCYICGHQSPYLNKWKCLQCTMLNDNLECHCTACLCSNPFIKKCSVCDNEYINSKLKEKCDNCIKSLPAEKIETKKQSTAIDKPRVVEKANRKNTWSCSKCSFFNSNEMENCVVCGTDGPGINKWSCTKCTFKNGNNVSVCVACGTAKNQPQNQPQKFPNSTFAIVVANFDGKNLADAFMDPMIIDALDPGKKKMRCRQCFDDIEDLGEELCNKCNREYYICECKMIVGPNRQQCLRCDSKRFINPHVNNDEPKWKCSWMKCLSLNDPDRQMCKECSCRHEVSENHVECIYCGWIKVINNKCAKCGTNY